MRGIAYLRKQDPLAVLSLGAGLPGLGTPCRPGLGQAGEAAGLAGAHAALQGVHQILLHRELLPRAPGRAAGLQVGAGHWLRTVHTGQFAQGRARQGLLAIYTGQFV